MGARFEAFQYGDIALRDELLLRKREADRRYLLSLGTDNLLRNFRLEAGLWSEPQRPEGIHWGWEAPTSQLRGHFLGHWLSAASMLWSATGDPEIRGKAEAVIDGLSLCQAENGGEWLGSIPEKYLEWAARGKKVWAPHYTIHKTFMGLLDAHRYLGSARALELAENWAGWFHRWTGRFSREELDDILDYETGGMLEAWADLFGLAGKAEYRELMDRYCRRRLFDPLLAGRDVLTNMHANTTIPEILGAARAFEVTGEGRWLDIVRAYWDSAVTRRGQYCTGGQSCGEVWSPVGELSARLGDKNQEHCTVYNMMRLAEFLLRHTGDASYADYWERNLRNGILAQGFWEGTPTHGEAPRPLSGLVAYFLPLRPGSRKLWASETGHFYCCHGTLTQANASHAAGIYYRDGEGVAVCQFISSELRWSEGGIPARICLSVDSLGGSIARIDGAAQGQPGAPDRLVVDIRVECGAPAEFPISIRLPWWLAAKPLLRVGGAEWDAPFSPSSFLTLRRTWKDETIHLELPKALRAESLPGDPGLVAFMDGPDVLAGLVSEDRTLVAGEEGPAALLAPDNEREWRYWTGGYRTRGQDRDIRFIPLRDVGYEDFAVYFRVGQGSR
jgi:DUF1680 family protein